MSTSDPIRFKDGASYEAMMGGWSREVGELFLEWLASDRHLDWLDVGCGSGAFTNLVAERCSPRHLLGIDPSVAQLDFARSRGLAVARFEVGDAMSLDVADNSFDVAVAALVMHFMPDPVRGVSEMVRVVRPGGTVAAYSWDLSNDGFPYAAVNTAMRGLGLRVPEPPHPEAADMQELARLWQGAGMADIEQQQFTVAQAFDDFEHYWRIATSSPRIAAGLATLSGETLTALRTSLAELLVTKSGAPIRIMARANAIMGTIPGP
jgi:SAM-dependent methyltransferase